MKYRATYSAYYNAIDGSANLFLPLYYKYTNSWVYLFYGNIAVTVVSGAIFYFYMT